jgi:hypothetical protein
MSKRCANCRYWTGPEVENPWRRDKPARICILHRDRGRALADCVFDGGGLCGSWQTKESEKHNERL